MLISSNNKTNLTAPTAAGKGETKTPGTDNDTVSLSKGSPSEELPDLRSMKSCFTKEKAMNALLNAECNATDAMSDLKVIQDNMKKNEPLEDATNQFVSLLKFEGRDYTSNVQEDFKMVGDSLRPDEKRRDSQDLFKKLAYAENDFSDARSDYQFLDKQVSEKETRRQLTEEFIGLLKYEGADNTSNTQKDFEMVGKSIKTDETREKSLLLLKQLAYAENDFSDARDDYQFLDKMVSKEESREQLTGQFLGLLKFEGIGDTASVQKDFQMIGESLKPGETRQGAIEQFKKLSYAENEFPDARSNYQFLDKMVSKEESREQLTAQFIGLLKFEGIGDTSSVQKDFEMIGKLLKEGEKREDAISQFKKLAYAENEFPDARENFKFINKFVSDTETRGELTEQFIRVLKSVGEGNSAQAREMFAQLH